MHKNNVFRKGLAVGIIVMVIVIAVLPATGIVVKKNTKLEEQQIVEESTTNKGEDVDWWPMFQYDGKNTGCSPCGTVGNTGDILWTFDTLGNIAFSSSAIDKTGTIYVGSELYLDELGTFDGYLFAISPNGTEKWRYDTNDGIPSSPALGNDGTIYVGSDNESILFALNPDGSLKWSLDLPFPGWIYPGSPTIGEDGTIYIHTWGYEFSRDGKSNIETIVKGYLIPNGMDGRDYPLDIDYISELFAVNPDGTVKWSFDTGGEGESTPAIGEDGTIYVGGWGAVFAIYPNGTQKWRFDTSDSDARIASSPAIDETGTIYIGSWKRVSMHETHGSLLALYPNGTKKWEYDTNCGIFSTPSIGDDGTIYVGTDGVWPPSEYKGIFYAFYPNGTKKWEYDTNGFIFGSPAISADGTIYITCRGSAGPGKLFALSPDGTEKWSIEISDQYELTGLSPSIDNRGIVYVHGVYNDNTILYAIGIEDSIPPETTCELDGELEGDIYISDVKVTLNATDDNSGVQYTMYKLDNSEWQEYVEPFVVSSDDEHTVFFYSVDFAGNVEEEKSCTFIIEHSCPIEIEIKGGFGVIANIKNNGVKDATNVIVRITLEGGFILIGKNKTDTISSLAPGESKPIRSQVFGFGKPTITVTAKCAEATATGFVFVFFVLGLK